MLKAVILIGGPQKGTRFRPLSFEVLILNSIVLPHKELSRSFTNQIIL
uniref:GDP-mannose pyrophosphorylase A n=7 Tax=Boreoeutheria TaxID=1437010 RepID=A0A804HIM4_HUMAN